MKRSNKNMKKLRILTQKTVNVNTKPKGMSNPTKCVQIIITCHKQITRERKQSFTSKREPYQIKQFIAIQYLSFVKRVR